MNNRCCYHGPRRLPVVFGYLHIRDCLYDWFVRGWTVEAIADKTGHSTDLIESMLESYEQDYKYGENTIPTIQRETTTV